MNCPILLSECNVEHHHHEETDHYAECAGVGMLVEVRLGDKLLHDDIQHRAGGGGKQPRHERRQLRRSEHNNDTENRLDNAAQRPENEGFRAAEALLMQRQRDRRAFGDLNPGPTGYEPVALTN